MPFCYISTIILTYFIDLKFLSCYTNIDEDLVWVLSKRSLVGVSDVPIEIQRFQDTL